MKLIVTVLLIALVSACDNDSDVSSQMDEIVGSEFGRTLLNTIEVQLQNSAPLDRLLETLQNLEETYQKDQREDDKQNSDFQKQCDSDLSALETEIAVAQTKQVELQGVIDSLKPVLQQRTDFHEAKGVLRNELQNEIDALETQRQNQASEFEAKRQDMQMVIQVINQAKHIFENSFGGSFLQSKGTPIKPEILAQVSNHFTKIATQTSKQQFNKPFSTIFKFLATMTSTSKTSSPALVDKIIKLCDQLLQKIDESWSLERKSEEQRYIAFQAYITLLTKDMNNYNSQIANLEAEIQSLQNRLDSNTASSNDVLLRISDKNQRKDDRRQECQESVYDNVQRREKRDQDRSLVSKLICIVQSNLRILKEYIALRIAAGDTRLG